MTPCLFSRFLRSPRAAIFTAAAAIAGLILGVTATPLQAGDIVFTEYDLPNGLHVILHPEHSAPVVASYVLYHVGSKNERSDRTGFAHFFEHLMFEGSENIPRGRIDKLVTGAGGNLNASTSFDQTNYHINLPANQLPLAIWIESERMLHAKVEQIGVDTQRQVVKEERRMRYDNQPYGGLFEELAKMVFAGTPYSWVPIGSVQYIDQAKLEEFREFYKTYYVPNNATLVLAGDFEVEPTKQLVETYFGPIPRGPEPLRPVIEFADADATAPTVDTKGDKPTPVIHEMFYKDGSEIGAPYRIYPHKGRTVDVKRDNTPLPASLHAWLAPRETDPDAYAVEMLTNILASGRSSRLYRRLVDQEQAARQAQAFPFLQESVGMIGVFAVGNSGVPLERLDALMDEEVAKVQKDGVTEEEWQKVRNGKEAEKAASNTTMISRASALADYHVFYGDTNLINTELDRYLKVTREDIKRVANQYLTTTGRNTLHYPVPEEKAEGKE